ncbi:hypothetical protein [Metabacillus litoralis]|uniref:hypothetical protein n=1 Tax=Metabacillus TaxID=2675233 RepID=UPI001B994240|nr:hypothetical protein [Metabacillus litoralis]MCM3164537.1 hypothetical protein [Metabacillus litoralis]
MKKIIFVGVLLAFILVVSVVSLKMQAEKDEVIFLKGKELNEQQYEEFRKRTFKLKDFINEKLSDSNLKLNTIELFPKQLIQIDSMDESLSEKEVEKRIRNIINLAKEESILEEDDPSFDVLVTIASKESVTNKGDKVDNQLALKELTSITDKVIEVLKSYEGIGDIETDYQSSLTIQTSLDSINAETQNIAREIQDKVEKVLNSKELESISKIDSYKIYVTNKDGKVIPIN